MAPSLIASSVNLLMKSKPCSAERYIETKGLLGGMGKLSLIIKHVKGYSAPVGKKIDNFSSPRIIFYYPLFLVCCLKKSLILS
jgi:hypothetical protein